MSDSSDNSPPRLFQGYGVELEYMIVRRDDLSVLPVSDLVLKELAGEIRNEVDVESISWSNELVLHVIELKNTRPAPALVPLGAIFADHVSRMNDRLDSMGAMLMPGAMHPFMKPREEAKIWPHDSREIYETFDAIFDCKRHGWSNLQSVQINYSFGDDEEFGRLHAAIRLVLPVVASLAASSPVMEGNVTGLVDTRLDVYSHNADRVASVTGHVIPEGVFTEADYDEVIYQPLYAEIAPLDPDGILRHPWLNARGAIAQFGRDAIEIRVLDMQECPQADIAVCCAVSAVVKALVEQRWTDTAHQQAWEVGPLAEIFFATVKDAEMTVLDNRDYLRLFGFPDKKATAQELWLYLVETLAGRSPGLDSEHLRVILDKGPLSRRLLRVLGPHPTRERVEAAYRALSTSLAAGTSFIDL